MWTVLIKDHTAHSVQSDLDRHCPQKHPVSSSIWNELRTKGIKDQKVQIVLYNFGQFAKYHVTFDRLNNIHTAIYHYYRNFFDVFTTLHFIYLAFYRLIQLSWLSNGLYL